MAAIGGGAANGEWIQAGSGFIPPNAFPGGDNDGEPIFVARGHVGGSIATGSLLGSHGCCYIAWGGEAHPLEEYEVLCNFNGTWIDWSGSQMPRNAYVAGQSEANDELMYVGRAIIDGILKVGKVHPSHGVTYIPHEGREIAFSDYEILVTELNTPDKLEYNFIPNNTGFVQFRVRANQDAHVALTVGAAECDPMYEVFIGSWNNSKTVIRKNRTKPDVAEADTPGILNGGEFRGFWVRYENGTIAVGTEGNFQPICSWRDSEIIPIEYIGVCTGWGATGSWIIEPPRSAPSAPTHAAYQPPAGYPTPIGYPAPTSYPAPTGYASGASYPHGAISSVCWVPASSGQVPPNALIGGEDNGEPMAVMRANFNDGLIPGKVISSHGCGWVPWGGNENQVQNYEVLCDFHGDWVECHGGTIPPNALAGGQSETGEPLYIGRVLHQGAMTVGKVQQSHGVCYIPYGGQELGFQDYQILVTRS